MNHVHAVLISPFVKSFKHRKEKGNVLVIQWCLTLCDPMDCSLPSSSVHGIPQARILDWVAMPSSRGYSQPRDWIWVSFIHCGQIPRAIWESNLTENFKISSGSSSMSVFLKNGINLGKILDTGFFCFRGAGQGWGKRDTKF